MSLERSSPENGVTRRDFLRLGAKALVARAVITSTEFETPEIISEIPSEESLNMVFATILKQAEIKKNKKMYDYKNELYAWDIKFACLDGLAQIEYARAGPSPEGNPIETKIFVVIYDANGVQASGSDLAIFVNGEWVVDEEYLENLGLA